MSEDAREAQRGQSTGPTSSGDVFISYASQDKPTADAVCAALESAGVVCWIAPRNVTPGEFYAESIVHAIDSARVVVVVLSQNAAASQHVLREVERASSKRLPLVAFRTDAAPLPAGLGYFLNSSQWLDAQAIGIDQALSRLVEAVRSALSQPAVAAAAGPRAPAQLMTRERWRPVLIALVVVAVAVSAYFATKKYQAANHSAAPAPVAAAPAAGISEKSIAVLPFVDMSEKHDEEYFADGLSEELIDHLTHNADLRVIARTSSFAFKGKNEDMRSIATQLGVAHLLEGSVRKAGGELRITAQLIRASDGVHLWSEIYDRKLTDIFKVQDEISKTVATALNAALNTPSATASKPASQGTTNIAAYNLVLQGNYIFWRGGKGDNGKAVEYLLQALKLDPNYALAWAKLARFYAWQGYIGELSAAEGVSKGRAAADRALALDPNSAEAYYARANISRLILGDWAAATADNERAAALSPLGELGYNARANILSVRADMSGHYDEAIKFARQRLMTDPLDVETMMDLGFYEQHAGHFEESAAISRRLLELSPGYVVANAQYGQTLLLMGKNLEALAATQKESDEAAKSATLSCVYWALGRHAESDAALAALERGFPDSNVYDIASVHAWRGEADAAFAWLDRAYLLRKGTLHSLRGDSLFNKLHHDPRFEALLRKAKLVA